MKKILFFLILFISVHTYAFNGYNFSGKVIKVSDGDTITVLTNDKKQIRVRLLNIDAPESKQPYGNQAKQLLNKLVYSKHVYIQSTGKDKYDRVLGKVHYGQINVNKQMVYSGYAWAYRKHLNDRSYIELENLAKSNKRGLWQDKSPIEPEKWRRMQKQ